MHDYREFERMLGDARRESDRGCALVLAANIDNRLRDALVAHFVPMSRTQIKEIFDGSGALSTFSAKTHIAFALGLLAKNEYHDINIIRKVRNLFAHEEHGYTFRAPDVRNLCGSLEMYRELAQQHPQLVSRTAEPRDAFQITAASITLLLIHRENGALHSKRQLPKSTSILPQRIEGGMQR